MWKLANDRWVVAAAAVVVKGRSAVLVGMVVMVVIQTRMISMVDQVFSVQMMIQMILSRVLSCRFRRFWTAPSWRLTVESGANGWTKTLLFYCPSIPTIFNS
jgi:hypothetical protein